MKCAYSIEEDSVLLKSSDNGSIVRVEPNNSNNRSIIITPSYFTQEGETEGAGLIKSTMQGLEEVLGLYFSGTELEEALCFIIDNVHVVDNLPGYTTYRAWRRKFFSRMWRIAHPREA